MTPLRRPVTRKTVSVLDGTFGCDRGRSLAATLDVGDLLVLRPVGTRRPEVLSLMDAYKIAMRYRVNRTLLEEARDRKAKMEAVKRERAVVRAAKRDLARS